MSVTIAILGSVSWLLMVIAVLGLGRAAKRGDEMARSTPRSLRPGTQTDAKILTFDVMRSAARAGHTSI
jgi:hypothetical protein